MNDDDFAQLLANFSNIHTKEVIPVSNNNNFDDFEELLRQAAAPQTNQTQPAVTKPVITVQDNNNDDFMAQLMSFNEPVVITPQVAIPVVVAPVTQAQVVKPSVPSGPSAFDLFEKEQAKINEANLKEAQRLQRIEDVRIEAINEQTRKEIELEDKKRYSSYDESSGWYDPSALETAARFISNINNIDSKTRNYIKAVYHIKANFIGHLDTTEMMLRFKTPISKIKLYMELLENALPVR